MKLYVCTVISAIKDRTSGVWKEEAKLGLWRCSLLTHPRCFHWEMRGWSLWDWPPSNNAFFSHLFVCLREGLTVLFRLVPTLGLKWSPLSLPMAGTTYHCAQLDDAHATQKHVLSIDATIRTVLGYCAMLLITHFLRSSLWHCQCRSGRTMAGKWTWLGSDVTTKMR